VTENLYDTLFHLRLPSQPQTLWIDAVCINQEDDLEKSYLVRQLRDIYYGASGVLIWLGRWDEDITHAVDVLRSGWKITRGTAADGRPEEGVQQPIMVPRVGNTGSGRASGGSYRLLRV
jgi:heterokaryon incompatibility protein (HET)